MGETLNTIISIFAAIGAIINFIGIFYVATKKLKPEVKKIESESDSAFAAAAKDSLEGAEISNNMLVTRINELRSELDIEKELREQEIQREREARRRDAEYFRRRIVELEREARDYRNHIARLIRQVISFGGTPEPFIPSPLDESDPSIPRVRAVNKE